MRNLAFHLLFLFVPFPNLDKHMITAGVYLKFPHFNLPPLRVKITENIHGNSQ